MRKTLIAATIAMIATIAALPGCAPATAGAYAGAELGVGGSADLNVLYTQYDDATGLTSYVTPGARVIATGLIETPAPRISLGANCAGRSCVPTGARLWFTRTAHDLALQNAHAPLVLSADGRVMQWDEPRYVARPAGLPGTSEMVEVMLTLDEVQALANARTVVGRIGGLRDFEIAPEGLRVFDMMLGVLRPTPSP